MTKERLCVYAINRDVDKVRWDSVCSSARKSRLAELVRVPAYDGYSKEFSAPRALENLLGLREPRTLKGRPACFLSHVKAWSLIAADPAPYGVVIEDDVILSDQFDDFVTYARAGDVPDIGFLNIRMCNQRNLAYPNDPRKWISTGDILLKLSKDLKPGQFAPAQSTAHGVLTEPGGDAYLLTRAAASALLDAVRVNPILPIVDYMIYFSSMNKNVFETLNFNFGNLPDIYSNYCEADLPKLNGAVYVHNVAHRVHHLAGKSSRLTGGAPS